MVVPSFLVLVSAGLVCDRWRKYGVQVKMVQQKRLYTHQQSHVGVLSMEVRGAPVTSTHWKGLNTTPTCDPWNMPNHHCLTKGFTQQNQVVPNFFMVLEV